VIQISDCDPSLSRFRTLSRFRNFESLILITESRILSTSRPASRKRNDLEIQITPHSFDCFDHTRRSCSAVHLLVDLDAFHKCPKCILGWQRVVLAFSDGNMGGRGMDRFPARPDEFYDLSHCAVATLLSSRVPGLSCSRLS